MKEYKVLVSIMAECESDFKEQLDALDCYELKWFCEMKNGLRKVGHIKVENLICDGCGINNNDNTEVLMKSINSTRLLKGNETAILCNGCYEGGACCWDEENNCVYGFESISPTKMACLGCGQKQD